MQIGAGLDKKTEKMSEMAFNDPSTASNPISLSKKDFLDLYLKSFQGNL